VKGATSARGYGSSHQQVRRHFVPLVKAGKVDCARCGKPIDPGELWDLGHVDGDRQRYAGPEHRACNRATSSRRPGVRKHRSASPVPQPPPTLAPPVRPGLDVDDKRWRKPWLRELRKVPADAVWPRLMTVPHPAAKGSLGVEFAKFALERSGRPLRWWQRLVAARLLEVDKSGDLLWETMLLSLARQLGKSWFLRELSVWRIHQGGRFGEPQDLMFTGKDVAICREIQRPVRIWAKNQPGLFKVREVNGQESIEYLPDGSRYMIRAKDAVYGYSVSCAVADEAWKVKPATIDEALTPTMVERAQPQLLLVSTAHRMSTSLMLSRRLLALEQLEDGDGDLLIEWSAPPDADLDDVAGWREASPHWTPKREKLIGRQLQAARAGELHDPDEPDPEQSFRAQWLNQWPQQRTEIPLGEDLLPPGRWQQLTELGLPEFGPLWVAVEDAYGRGGAVAAAARTEDDRIEVAGWTFADWDTAIEAALRLGEGRTIRQLIIGASMLSRVAPGTVPSPVPAGSRELRPCLALLRDLAATGMIVHDPQTAELDEAVQQARVKEVSTGLQLLLQEKTHLVRALAWAVGAAHKPQPMPTIH